MAVRFPSERAKGVQEKACAATRHVVRDAGSVAHSSHRDAHPRPSLTHKTFPNTMPHTKRPLLLAALALVAFAALFNPAAAGDTAAVGTMDPPKEDALLMPTDAEADPAATDAAAKDMDMAWGDMDMEPAAEEDAELKPIGETLQADPEFSTLVALVTAAADESGATAEDLAAEGPFTLFAPVNEAFTKFLETSGLSVEDVLASPDLKEILSHHVVEG